MDLMEGVEFVFKVVDGSPRPESFEDLGLEQAKNAGLEAVFFGAASIVNGGGKLRDEGSFAGVALETSVEATERAVAGAELKTFGTRLGQDDEHLVVGVPGAKVDDELLVHGVE